MKAVFLENNYKMCLTHQNMIQVSDFPDWLVILNMKGVCNCGKQYKDHEHWKEYYEKYKQYFK